jgi:FKBP-type peptidyl-prolyl cis-trans isomerase FkpA
MIRCLLIAGLVFAAAACRGSTPPSPTTTTSGTQFSQTDLVVGTGTQAASGNLVTVSYTGWLFDGARTDGKGSQFDSSQSFPFRLGTGQVIPGWDQGVVGMRIGGQRRLVIPPSLAYGTAGRAPIPPNATLVFDVALLAVVQ